MDFREEPLPDGAKPFSHWMKPENYNAEFEEAAIYMIDRGEDLIGSYEFFWTPNKSYSMYKRVIIPFNWDGKIVGYTARDITGNMKNRYYGVAQPNYIFNTEVIDHESEYVLVCEGSLDAVAIGGVAMLGDKMSPEQAEWLTNTGKKIIIVPDREKKGGALVDIAVQRGWYVSFPRWPQNISAVKDPAEAVKKLGKLYTVWTILDAIVRDKFTINVMRQKLVVEKKK
jgi:DNA primase